MSNNPDQTTALNSFFHQFTQEKIPLLAYCNPCIETLNPQQTMISIPLTAKTMNHLQSMYLGVLTIGAECTAMLMPFMSIMQQNYNIHLIVKSLTADFLKRAESDVSFICNDGELITDTMQQVLHSDKRLNTTVTVSAFTATPKIEVANFQVTLSMKQL